MPLRGMGCVPGSANVKHHPAMQCNFFASGADLLPVLEQVERKHRVIYVAAGLFTSSALAPVELGAVLKAIDRSSDAAYLVTPATVKVQIRPVPQRSGEILYAVDQSTNPLSITLRPGGMAGTNVLLPGVVGTVSKKAESVELHRAFASAIGKCFKRVQSYWVGPAALTLLAQGVRLTHSAKAPRQYDLVLAEGCGV
jgi:hypothetical protein